MAMLSPAVAPSIPKVKGFEKSNLLVPRSQKSSWDDLKQLYSLLSFGNRLAAYRSN